LHVYNYNFALMGDLFTAQPNAFASFDNFSPEMTPAQEDMLAGKSADEGFAAQAIMNPSNGPEERALRFFGNNNLRFIRISSRPSNGVNITSNALGTYENQR